MIIDKQGKLFGKISIVDLFIVLVIILACALLGFKIAGNKSAGAESSQRTYVVKVEGVKANSFEYIKKGSVLSDDTGTAMGKVENIRAETAVNFLKNSQGQFVEIENPERIDVYITVIGEGRVVDGSFFLDGKSELLIGSERFFSAEKLDFAGTIIEIKE